MGFLLMLHSIIRWLIVIVSVPAVVKLGLGWLRNMQFKGMDRGLVAAFSGLMDLNWLLGMIFLLWNGFATEIGFPMYRIEHALTMTAAVFVSHLPSRWKEAGDKVRFRNSFLAVLIALLLVYGGVAGLPGGWSR